MAARETYEDFRRLASEEVLKRAREAEERPRGAQAASSAWNEVAWRRLYREMRGKGVTEVADLDARVVEKYASRLGYGYMRVGGARETFMPFEDS